MSETKVCATCEVDRPLKDYQRNTRKYKGVAYGGLNNQCRVCRTRVRKETKLRFIYGIDRNEYDMLWESQEGRCAICQTPLLLDDKNTHVDHCHSGNFVRGLLCFSCNVGLGSFRDNPDFLLKAIRYLGSPVGRSHEMEVRRAKASMSFRKHGTSQDQQVLADEKDKQGLSKEASVRLTEKDREDLRKETEQK